MQIRGTDAARNVRARIIPDRFFCWTRDLNWTRAWPPFDERPKRKKKKKETAPLVGSPPFNKGDAVTDRRH